MVTKGDRSRAAVTKAARRLIALNGYQSTSIQKVADAVGVSQSAVLHHYPNKPSLFRGVLMACVQENDQIAAKNLNSGDSGMDRLVKFFETNYEWAVEHDYNAQIMTLLFHFATYDPEFAAMQLQVRAGALSKISDALLAGVRERLLPRGLDVPATAEMLHDLLMGAILFVVTGPRAANSRSHLREKWRKAIHALSARAMESP